jgi:hypothetical protein
MNCSAVTLFTVGDIGNCSGTGDTATALLLDTRLGPILTLGDATEGDGDAEDYANCFDPDWGRHRSRLLPTLGNHDYWVTDTADGYLSYFAGNLAGFAPSAVDPTQG